MPTQESSHSLLSECGNANYTAHLEKSALSLSLTCYCPNLFSRDSAGKLEYAAAKALTKDHCIETLRESVMCNPDLGLYVYTLPGDDSSFMWLEEHGTGK